MINISNILVSVDFSAGSRACVEYATAMAEAFHSNVTLFHVFERVDLMASIVPGADARVDDETDRALAQRHLERLRTETPRRANVQISVAVIHGSPAEEILAYSRDKAFDMVVIGTHGQCGRGGGTRSVLRRPDASPPFSGAGVNTRDRESDTEAFILSMRRTLGQSTRCIRVRR